MFFEFIMGKNEHEEHCLYFVVTENEHLEYFKCVLMPGFLMFNVLFIIVNSDSVIDQS